MSTSELQKSIEIVVDNIRNRNYKLGVITSRFIHESINDNFHNFGRWDGKGRGLLSGGNQPWLELSQGYKDELEKKGEDTRPTLRRSDNLFNSISVIATNRGVEIGSNVPYAGLLQFGGRFTSEDGREAYMPPRPFITLTPEDTDEIIRIINEHITKQQS